MKPHLNIVHLTNVYFSLDLLGSNLSQQRVDSLQLFLDNWSPWCEGASLTIILQKEFNELYNISACENLADHLMHSSQKSQLSTCGRMDRLCLQSDFAGCYDFPEVKAARNTSSIYVLSVSPIFAQSGLRNYSFSAVCRYNGGGFTFRRMASIDPSPSTGQICSSSSINASRLKFLVPCKETWQVAPSPSRTTEHVMY